MNIWVALYRSSWAALGLLAVILVVSVFVPLVKEYRTLQQKKTSLEEEIRLEEQMISHLKRQQERLQYDPDFVERVAREEFSLAKPGETVFRFVEEESDAPAAGR